MQLLLQPMSKECVDYNRGSEAHLEYLQHEAPALLQRVRRFEEYGEKEELHNEAQSDEAVEAGRSYSKKRESFAQQDGHAWDASLLNDD